MGQDKAIPEVLDDALGFNIYRVALLYKRELVSALAEYALTPEQWQTLVALWVEDRPRSQGELVELTLRDKHSVSRLIARMERDGWIERCAHESDRRVTMIRPTAKANECRETIEEALKRHFVPIGEALTLDERRTLLALLQKLRAHLEAETS